MACPVNNDHPGLTLNNHPFDEIVEGVAEALEKHPDALIFQKFSCGRCGARQTIAEPNKLFTSGSCEVCNFVTDINITGCNYMMVIPATKEGADAMKKMI